MLEEDLINNYKSAFLSHDNIVRENSSKNLTNLMVQNPEKFTHLSCSCLNSNEVENNIKKIIITGLTKSLKKNPKNKNFKSIWSYINQNSKDLINQTGFNLLINKNHSIKNLSADLISTIYILDLQSEKSFNKILFSLAENVNHKNKEIQKASIITLGYICENLFLENYLLLNKEEIDTLLKGIFKGLENYNEVSNSSVLSLGYSINFLKEKFKDKEIRDFIYDSLLKFICKSKEVEDFELMITCIRCLEEIIHVNYEIFDFYFEVVFQQILDCGKIKNDKIILAVNEFFKTLLETEKTYKKGFFDIFWENLANYSLVFLLDYEENEEELYSGLSLTQSFFYLLNTINSIFILNTQKTLLKFVYDYIEDDKDRIKIVALLVFESLLEFSEKNAIFEDLTNGFFGLLKFIKTENYFLQRQALIFLTKIAEFHSYLLLNQKNFEQLLDIFLIILDSNISTDQGDKIKVLVLQTLEILSEKAQNQKSKEILRKNTNPISNSIFQCFSQTENLHLISSSFTTLFSFIIHIFKEDQLNTYFQTFQEMLLETQKIKKKQIKSLLIESLQINLTAIFNQIKTLNYQLIITNNTNDYISKGYKYTVNLIKEKNDYYDEELYYMSMILIFDKSYFKGEVKNFIYTYLIHGLRRVKEDVVFKNSLDALEVIISNYCDYSEPFIYDILPNLIGVLKNGKCSRDLNFKVIHVLSQIVYYFGKIFCDNLEDVFEIVKDGCEAVFTFLESDKVSDQNYGSILLKGFVNLNICIIHGIYLDNIYKHYDNLIENNICIFIQFLEEVCKIKEPDLEIATAILGLMIDFYNKKTSRDLILVDFYKKIRMFLENNRNEEFSELLNYADEIYLD